MREREKREREKRERDRDAEMERPRINQRLSSSEAIKRGELLQGRVKVLRARTGEIDVVSASPYVLRIPKKHSHALAPQARPQAQNDSQELIVAASRAESAIAEASQPLVQTCKPRESTKPSQTAAKATTDANRPSDATASTATARRRVPSFLQALHKLGEQLQSANIASERQQPLETLEVVATDDRQTGHNRNTSRSAASTAMMALARRSGPSRWPQRSRNIKEVRSRRAYHDPPLSNRSAHNTGHPRLCRRPTHEDRSSRDSAASAAE